METPAEYFGLKVIGYATTDKIASCPAAKYEVLKIVEFPFGEAGKSFMVNKWFEYHLRRPLWVTEQLGAKFKALEKK